MEEILKKEEELNQLNKDIDESLQRLKQDNRPENYERHNELLDRRLRLFQELYDMYRSKWEELKLPVIDDSNPIMKELIQKEDTKFENTLRFGGTREFLEEKIHEQRSIQTTLSDTPHADGDGEGAEKEG